MKILIFGSNGMLGQALNNELKAGFNLVTPTRNDCDFENTEIIYDFIMSHKPDLIINCAAIVDINACAANQAKAFKVNALAVAQMAQACNALNAKLLQISTDHYYQNENDFKHPEDHPISLLNEYAHSKFLGEAYAQLAARHCIVRTNIIGFNPAKKTGFLEWAVNNIINSYKMNLFIDYFTSSIDIYNFSKTLKHVIDKDLSGLYNIACSEVLSKAEFIMRLSKALKTPLCNPTLISVNTANTGLIRRANSIGLNVKKVQTALGIEMPNSDQVIQSIIEVYHEQVSYS